MEGRVAAEADGAGVVAAKLAELDQQRVDALDVSGQHDLVLAVDVGDEDLLEGRRDEGACSVIVRVERGAARGVAKEGGDGLDEGGEAVGLADEGDHAVFATFGLGGFAAAAGHDLGSAADHFQGVRVKKVLGNDKSSEFAEGVAEGDVDAFGGVEGEFLFEDAQDHDGSGHDGWLGVFGSGEGRIGAVGDDGAEGDGEDMVHFFEEGFAGSREGFQPGSGHANTLDALACKQLAFRVKVEGGGRRHGLPGKKRAVLGLVGVAAEDHLGWFD